MNVLRLAESRIPRTLAFCGVIGAFVMADSQSVAVDHIPKSNTPAEIANRKLEQVAVKIGSISICADGTDPAIEYDALNRPVADLVFVGRSDSSSYQIQTAVGVNAAGKPVASKTEAVEIVETGKQNNIIKIIVSLDTQDPRWAIAEEPISTVGDPFAQYGDFNFDGPVDFNPATESALATKAWDETVTAVALAKKYYPPISQSC